MFKGFFNRMYNGNPNRPDLDPGDMPKNRFELFFTTLGVRFGDLIKLNLLFIVFLLPLIIWTVLSYMALMNCIPLDSNGNPPPELSADVIQNMMGVLQFYLLVNLVIFPLAGPPLAGLTYITRNYARDEHAWLWSDFKEQMKANWKQSMALMFILAAVLLIALITNNMYTAILAAQGQSWMWVMQLLFIIFVGIFISSYMYAFPLLVTYKLKLGQVIRNSLMLALGRLPFTILFAFMALLPLILGVFLASVPYVSLVLLVYYLLLGFSLTAFITNSYTNATFDKLMRAEDQRNNPPVDPEDREIKP